MNGTGALIMRADRVGAETVLARIVAMVAEAQRSRAPIQRLADTVAGWFVPAVIAVGAGRIRRLGGLGTGPCPRLRADCRGFGADHRLSLRAGSCDADVDHGRHRQGRRRRRADPLRRSAGAAGESGHAGGRQDRHVDRGQASGDGDRADRRLDRKRDPDGGWPPLERASEHPLAAAIVAAARERGLAVAEPADFRSVTGKGVTGMVDGRHTALGNRGLMQDLGIVLGELEVKAEALRRDGATALYLAVDGGLAGIIAVADPIKPTTADALDQLRARGIRIVMLTGDTRTTADAVARRLGIARGRGRGAAGG